MQLVSTYVYFRMLAQYRQAYVCMRHIFWSSENSNLVLISDHAGM